MPIVKVNSNRSFGKIDPTASPLPIDAALAEGYSPEVVVYAERLKGQYYDPNNPDKYSDSFFLEYASREFSICYSYRFGVKKSGLDDVPDPRFSGYSYVEILSMVNNGYNVPKEVIAWAKAQQEADVVDYVVLSEDAENSTASETGEVSNESETNKLRAQAKEQIVKTHKSQKSLNTQKDNLEVLTQKAADITQKQSKILQDNSLGEMENMVKDWKALDEKQKDGVLSSFEQGIYKKLSQKISTSTKAFKEVEENSRSLNEFLDSIESLRYESSDAINTAQETIDASYNLSNLSNPVNEANRKHTYQTVKSSDTGLLNDILAGVTDDTISYVAEHMGQDLNVSGQSSLEDVSGGLKADISKFADEYISKARYIADFSKNIIDEGNSSKSSKDEPVEEPSAEPSVEPTVSPVEVEEPSIEPSVEPTVAPVEVEEPSIEPSVEPTVAPVEVEEPSAEPSVEPTVAPVEVEEPSAEPSVEPTVVPVEVEEPSIEPSVEPTVAPVEVEEPSIEPSVEPTVAPVEVEEPSVEPSVEPTVAPVEVEEPSAEPSVEPTVSPVEVEEPSIEPSVEPTVAPVEVEEPSVEPSVEPTVAPVEVEEPSIEPSVEPTVAPVEVEEPSIEPSVEPTVAPVEVEEPSAEPSVEPTVAPVEVEEPSAEPSVEPTVAPVEVEEPSAEPSVEPTVAPVEVEEPSAQPSVEPTVAPVEVEEPSIEPSVEPTVAPVEVEEPSAEPSVEPTVISADEDEMFIANEKSLEQRPIQARAMTRGVSAQETSDSAGNVTTDNEPLMQTTGNSKDNNDDEKITFPAVNQVSEQAENEVNSMKVTLGKRASASESVLPIAVNTPDDSEQNNNLPQAVKNEEVKKVEDTKSVDNQNKEQIKEEKDNGIISDYGKNVNFEAMAWSTFGVSNAATMAMIFTGSFYPFASAMMNLAGASVFDLEDKKSSVDNSANITKKDVANADKELFKQSTDANKTLKAHDKNLKDAQALGEQYISLNEEAANDANAAMENEKSSAKPGEAADSTEAEAILTSYETEKEGVSANIDDIAQKDQKMLAQLNKPINTVQKTIVDSNGTVSDFSKVNDMLSERSGNNGGVAAAALAFGAEWCGLSGIVIATGISEMSNPFTYARGLQNYINGVNALGISLRVVASGAIALIASGKADDRVDANAQSISEMQKTLGKDDKILTNAAKELKKAEKQVPQPPAELDQKPETNTNSDKESSQKAALKESDNQKTADNNLRLASANVQDSEEIVKSAAVTLQNVNPKTETSDSVAKRLTRFNEDSTILANRKNRRVNAVSNVADGRNRK